MLTKGHGPRALDSYGLRRTHLVAADAAQLEDFVCAVELAFCDIHVSQAAEVVGGMLTAALVVEEAAVGALHVLHVLHPLQVVVAPPDVESHIHQQAHLI